MFKLNNSVLLKVLLFEILILAVCLFIDHNYVIQIFCEAICILCATTIVVFLTALILTILLAIKEILNNYKHD